MGKNPLPIGIGMCVILVDIEFVHFVLVNIKGLMAQAINVVNVDLVRWLE